MKLTAVVVAAVAGIPVAALAQVTGPSTAVAPYMVPSDGSSGVVFYSIATNGNGTLVPNETYARLNGPAAYRLVGIPDGMGVFRTAQDVANGTFSLLCNHELGQNAGIVRDHGSRGGLVSLWRIRTNPGQPNHLEVIGGQDLIQQSKLWRTTTSSYETYDALNPMPTYAGNVLGTGPDPDRNGFGRFCSADLAAPSAYRFGALGTDARIFMNGEEVGAPGRAFAHIATGPETGVSYELPVHGDYSWENSVASPFPQAKTVVLGADDATPGNVYVYIGTKQSAGNEVEKAGLTNGRVYAISVAGVTVNGSGQPIEDRTLILGNATSGPVTSKPFSLVDLGDLTGVTGAGLQSTGDALGQLNFLRPEDVAWDPINPRRAFIATTDSFTGNSRLWLLEFTDILNPENGGTLTMLADGSNPSSLAGGIVSGTGATDIRMMDNIATTRFGQVLIQEDVGNNVRLGRMWLYDIAADRMTEVGVSAQRFLSGQPGFITQDEETSGITDAYGIIGPGWWLLNMQAHAGISGELVEFGQLIAAFIPQTALCIADLDDGTGTGTPDGGTGIEDLLYYLSIYDAGLIAADLDDGSGTAQIDGGVSVEDLLFYLARFDSGC